VKNISGKKENIPETCEVHLLNSAGEFLYQGEIFGLSFPDRLIIEKSIEFFDDDEPCYIHRSAVAARLQFELETMIRNFRDRDKKENIPVESLPQKYRGYFEFYPGVKVIRLKED
jgi:hypothetical protein